ncbi:hypothetical protein AN643_02600 [Candidatus Epulonipiscioides saccharophilum]|nr:hypothetical protein AN643_02600 [Epulopiscium sp. SCG-B10WGA-EpuloB]
MKKNILYIALASILFNQSSYAMEINIPKPAPLEDTLTNEVIESAVSDNFVNQAQIIAATNDVLDLSEIEKLDEVIELSNEVKLPDVASRLETKNYYWSDTIGMIESFLYDIHGNLIRKIEKKGDTVLTTDYAYDLDNKLIQEVKSNGEIIDYQYNKKGLLVSKVQHHKDYKEKTTINYKYDDLDRLIATSFFNTKEQIDTDTYTYNDKGLLSAEYTEGNKYPKCKYFYDDDDNLIKIEYYGVEKKLSTKELSHTTTYTYDDLGRLSADNFYTYEYDDYGNLLKQSSIFGENSMYIDYVYDYIQIPKVPVDLDLIIEDIEIPDELDELTLEARALKNELEAALKSKQEMIVNEDWKEEYIDFINKIDPTGTKGDVYRIFYLDSDAIPELYIGAQTPADDQYIVSSASRYLTLSTYGLKDLYYYAKNQDGIIVIDNGQSVKEYALLEDTS